MRVVFVPADDEDDEAGSGEEREEDPGGFLQQRRMRIPMAASSYVASSVGECTARRS